MAQEDIKKVKSVKGWKVNHPFSFGNIFYAFLSLALVAIPAIFIFLPVYYEVDTGVMIKGLDLLIQFFKHFFMNPTGIYAELMEKVGGQLSMVVMGMFMAQSIIILLTGLFALVSFIYFMIIICRGYVKSAKVVRSLSIFDFIFVLLFALSWLVIYIFLFVKGYDVSKINVWWNLALLGGVLLLLIITCITYTNTYKDIIFEKDLEYHDDGEKDVVTHVTEVHNVTKVNYQPANTLPPNLTSIGGHAFAENQYLEIANIPMGISSLGGGAFANCLKLKVVSLPNSVKEIGFNCFFNCISLERINFAGTKEEWRHIKRGSNWLAKAKTTQVVCVDGTIVVNPFH